MNSAGFSWIDIAIIAILSLSALISLFRGFVREALSLVSWIAAFWIALVFCHPLSNMLSDHIQSPTIRLASAFAALFVLTLLVCAVINFFISTLVERTGLTGTDRLLGVIFGLARGILLVAALLLVAHLTPMPEEPWWKNSFLIPQFLPLEQWMQNQLPQSMSEHFQLSSN